MTLTAAQEAERERVVARHEAVPDELRRRGKGLPPKTAALLRRAVEAAAPAGKGGGVRQVLREAIAAPTAAQGTTANVAARLEAGPRQAWLELVRYYHRDLGLPPKGGLPTKTQQDALEKRAAAIVRQWPSAHAAAALVAPEGAADAAAHEPPTPKRSGQQRRAPTVGQRPYLHSKATDSRTTARVAAPVRVWEPPIRAAHGQLAASMPPRSQPYEPSDRQSAAQLREVRGWRMERVLEYLEVADAYFTIGAATTAVREWRAQGAGKGAMPPVEVLAAVCRDEVMDVLYRSEGGHMWSIAWLAPLDEEQLAWAMGSTWAADVLTAIRRGEVDRAPRGLTASKVRMLIGQATHGAATELAAVRTLSRMRVQSHTCHGWDRRGRTLGLIGAGIGMTGVQVAMAMSASIVWSAESCRFAGPVGRAVMLGAGHFPRLLRQAEHPELAGAGQGRGELSYAAGEVITLSCAYASRAGNGAETEPALQELRSVMEGVAARKPRFVIYETSDGLWSREAADGLRSRVEAILMGCAAYDWEAALISPHQHCGVGQRRRRVFYMAVRIDMLQEREERDAAKAASEGEESRGGPSGGGAAMEEEEGEEDEVEEEEEEEEEVGADTIFCAMQRAASWSVSCGGNHPKLAADWKQGRVGPRTPGAKALPLTVSFERVPYLKVKQSKISGWGVFAAKPFKPNETIAYYHGTPCGAEKAEESDKVANIDGQLVCADGFFAGYFNNVKVNNARLLNSGRIMAICHISQGEEITITGYGAAYWAARGRRRGGSAARSDDGTALMQVKERGARAEAREVAREKRASPGPTAPQGRAEAARPAVLSAEAMARMMEEDVAPRGGVWDYLAATEEAGGDGGANGAAAARPARKRKQTALFSKTQEAKPTKEEAERAKRAKRAKKAMAGALMASQLPAWAPREETAEEREEEAGRMGELVEQGESEAEQARMQAERGGQTRGAAKWRTLHEGGQ